MRKHRYYLTWRDKLVDFPKSKSQGTRVVFTCDNIVTYRILRMEGILNR